MFDYSLNGRRMMMKKLLVLLLVLGMASAANATLQISVNGDKEPVSSEIWLEPSQELTLDIWTDAIIEQGVGEGYWALSTGELGSISGGVPLGNGTDTTIYAGASSYVPGEGVWGGVGAVNQSSYAAGTVLYDQIIFHCAGEGDAVVTLYWDIFGTDEVIDSVTIHQIPEPMTVALLGLGGLFLLRRRK
jgi:hypothetical protein